MKLELDPEYNDPVLDNGLYQVRPFDIDLYWLTIRPVYPIDGLMMCTNCLQGGPYVPGNIISINSRLSSIFKDTLADTNSPALALQAIFTIITQMGYYSYVPYFDTLGDSIITVTESYYVPAKHVGYAAVILLLIIHLILVAASVACFAFWSRHTLLGNVWQAFTQAAEVIDENSLYNATTIPDQDIHKNLKEQGRDTEEWQLTEITRFYREPMGDMLEESIVSIRKKTV